MPSLLHGQAEAGRHRRPCRALRAPLRAAGEEVVAPSLDQLRGIKLRALVSSNWDEGAVAGAAASTLPGGAALFDPSSARAWVLIDDGEIARFGAALAWADRQRANSLDVLVDGASPLALGVVARRASSFSPAPSVWAVEERILVAAAPTEPVADTTEVDPQLVALLASHGLEVVVEHGVTRGEVLGLEVARTVGERLEVGVGRHDRVARAEMRPEEDVDSALDETIAAVRSLRRTDAPSHPANTLARSRWLRSAVCRSPGALGVPASLLRPVAPPLPWFDLPEAGAAPCVGVTAEGDPVVAVCSVGVDLDVVPTAADCRLLYGRSALLWLVMPAGDDLPVTRSLAGRLTEPASIHLVPRDWADLVA